MTTAIKGMGVCDEISGPCSIRDMLSNAGVAKLSPVHKLTEAEIRNDEYGFAREFTAILKPADNTTAMVEAIRQLSFVKSCSPPEMYTRF